MKFPRRSGILLHLTSLPGPGGIGVLGEEARRFIDLLAASGQRLWQILPLNPAGFGNCPYAASSAFAGNPLLIDPAGLVTERLLAPEELESGEKFNPARVDYGRVTRIKKQLLERAYRRFIAAPEADRLRSFNDFCQKNVFWLDDYSLFTVLQRNFNGAPWFRWPLSIAARRPSAVARYRKKYRREIEKEKFFQYLFFGQWDDLRRYARRRKVAIIGDIPFFVSHDSSDLWVRRRLFLVDRRGRKTVLSGVPPTDIDGTSQIWGNPLYNWEEMAADGYAWWKARFRAALAQMDIIRVDHFSGFYACWQIPPGAENSAAGRWEQGPSRKLFQKIERELGALPIIAEALEPTIYPEVRDLLSRLGYPGIRGLQFGFYGGENNPHMPEDYPENCAAYTGTHDDNTVRGWFAGLEAGLRKKVLKYLGLTDPGRVNLAMIRAVLSSAADTAIIPIQDLCGLDAAARMNIPGTPTGQWEWRYRPELMPPGRLKWLARLTARCGR